MSLYESSIHEELMRIREVLALSALLRDSMFNDLDKQDILEKLELAAFPEKYQARSNILDYQ